MTEPIRKSTDSVLKSYKSFTDLRSPSAIPAWNYSRSRLISKMGRSHEQDIRLNKLGKGKEEHALMQLCQTNNWQS